MPRRFALIAGANDGGRDRVTLRYAVDDARSMERVLGELGGLAEADRIVLAEPSVAALLGAVQNMRGRITVAESLGTRTELLVYYSGHSNEDGLLLGAESLAYAELRKALGEDFRGRDRG